MSTLSLSTPVEQIKPAEAMDRMSRLLFVPFVLLQGLFFLYVSQHRLIDGDEGFYLLASRLVTQHKVPYLDFFYTQAPLLPYVFGWWLKLTGFTWYSARVFCALLSTAVGAMIYWHACRETGKWRVGAIALLLFTLSNLVYVWYAIVKTFPLAMLFLFPVYMIFVRRLASTPGWMLAAGGVLFGLSVDTRSYVVGILPVFLWWLLRKKEERNLLRVAWFLGGFLVGLIPSLVLFFASPSAFLFNNLGYHAVRSGSGLIGDWGNKLLVVAGTLGGHYTGFQFTVISVSGLLLVIFLRPRRDASLFALVLGVALGFVSLLPTPASMQYFSLIMPFLILASVFSVNDFLATVRSPERLRLARASCGVSLALYLAFAIPTIRGYLFTGAGVPGMRDQADVPNYTLGAVTAVSKAIDEAALPHEQVVSFWPGYLFASWADAYPGFENNFAMWIAGRFSPEKRQQYRILAPADINQILAHHGPRLVVVGNQGDWNGGPPVAMCVSALRSVGYKAVRNVGDTSLWECCVTK